MRESKFADFKLEEYRNRIARMQAAMDEHGIDLLIITHAANMRYLFGFQNMLQTLTERIFIGLLPKSNPDDAVLFIPDDCQASPQTWVEDVHLWNAGKTPPFDESSVDLSILLGRIDSMGFGRACIGLELGPVSRMDMPVAQIDQLRKGLCHATFVDASPVIQKLRAVKSEAEIDILRQIGRISLSGIHSGLDSLTEGVSEAELCRRIHAETFRRGADGAGMLGALFGVDGFHRCNMYPTEHRLLKKNEWINIDGGDAKQGYYADVCRMAVFGKVSSKSLDVYAAIVEANRVIINAIAPGTPCSELYRVGAEVFEKSGFGDLMISTSVGHGLGLDAHEMPNLGRDNDQPLVEGMVVTVEPWIATQELGPLNLEDMVIVRKHGAELISKELRETTPLTKKP